MTMAKIKKIVFGHFETYECDPFYWIADLATLFTRTPRHKTMTRVVFWFYNIVIFVMLTGVFVSKNPSNMLAENLVFFSFLILLTINYGNMMRKSRLVNKMFQTVIKLTINNKRTANISLKNEMLESSKTLKYICLTFHFILSPIAYHLYAFFQITEETLPIKILKVLALNRSGLAKIYHFLAFYILPIHCILYVPTPIYTLMYCCIHIKFSLKQVVDEMKNFQQNDNELKASITERLHSNKYQQNVKKELIYYIKQCNAIKRASDYVNHCIKWRFLSIFIGGELGAIFNLVLILQVDFKSQIFQAGFLCILLAYIVIAAECGEQIQIECESIYIQAQQFNWYNYNRSNCQLLFMLLMQTREPLQLNCYNMVILNRIMILTFYQRVYSFISIFGAR